MTPKRKRILSYVGLFIAAAAIITPVTDPGMGLVTGLLMAVALGLPSWWWLRCEQKDQQAREAHAQVEAAYALLTDADRQLLAPLGEPALVDRKWRIITPIAVVALMLAGATMEQPPAETGPATSTTTTVTTTETATTTQLIRREPAPAALGTFLDPTDTAPAVQPGADVAEATE